MGSKNLKAVTASGNSRITVADHDRFTALKREMADRIRENPISGDGLPGFGTAVLVNIINENYILPTRNFQTAHFPAAEKVSGERMAESILVGKMGCHGCIIRCGRDVEVEGSGRPGPSTRQSGRSARTAGSTTWLPLWRQTTSATISGLTRSLPDRRSHAPWNSRRGVTSRMRSGSATRN